MYSNHNQMMLSHILKLNTAYKHQQDIAKNHVSFRACRFRTWQPTPPKAKPSFTAN